MNLAPQGIIDYAERHTSSEDQVLKALQEFTSGNVLFPEMISGHLQGRLLTLLSMLLRPQRILELGTYTGYSAICLAQGLDTGGRLTTIEYNSELEQSIRSYFERSGFGDRIELLIGDATRIVPGLEGPFDLIFIDADKKNYLTYYKMLLPQLSARGLIIVDNVLWQGKVADDAATDKETVYFRTFNEYVTADDSVFKVMLPVRDGLYLIMKKPQAG